MDWTCKPYDGGMEQQARKSHKDLILWQKALDLAVAVHEASAVFPRAEMFGLVSQIRRAAVSIPSNIAEGSARRSTREFIAYLHIARGSMAEVETQLLLAQRIGYVNDERREALQLRLDEVGRIMNAVITGLRRRLG
jgi:four helix bundle protein